MHAAFAKKAVEDAQTLRHSVLYPFAYGEKIEDTESLIGSWRFESMEMPGIGLRRNGTDVDNYYFELKAEGKAVVCVYGDTYETTWFEKDGCISFGNMELATLKLTMHSGKLCMSGYLGTTITFVKQAEENTEQDNAAEEEPEQAQEPEQESEQNTEEES